MTVAIISHPDCLLHDMGDNHLEAPARIGVIAEAIYRSDIKPKIKNYLAPLADKAVLSKLHAPNYIDELWQLSPQQGLLALDPDTRMNPYTLTAARRAAGAARLAVDLVMQQKAAAAFCNIRPPGHHAEYARAMGFCFFNNVMLAVHHVLQQYHLKRVAIIDFDVHHGNGTQDLLGNNSQVLFCSSFEYPLFPFSGIETTSKNTLNLALAPGTTGRDYRKLVRELWWPALREFRPEMIFISAGFDGHLDDPLGDLQLTDADYFWITQQLKSIADFYCQGRIVSVLEGGYALPALASSALAHVRALVSQ
ncbi:MAG: histone deacetylase family protein [Coxiellaceae bacterium]|nr:MAG: histone deacetylase family protein [Coxiellaceae bacterium]